MIYAQLFGVAFGVGIVLLILIHESGHVVVARVMGMPVSLPVMIPFLGAFVSMKQQPRTVAQESIMAIGGPVLGSIAAGLCYAGYLSMPDSSTGRLLQALAYFGFLINLFNLIPLTPLDGGRVFRALMWKLTKNFRAATQMAVRSGLMIALTLIVTGMFYFLKAPDYGITGIWLLSVGLIIALMLGTTEGRNFGAWRVKRGTVEDVMKRDVVQVPPTMKVSDFINKVLSNNHYTSFPVVDNRRLHGLLLLDELQRVPEEQWPGLLARDVMRPVSDGMFMNASTPLALAQALLQSNGIGRAIVLDANGFIVGYVSLNDLAATR